MNGIDHILKVDEVAVMLGVCRSLVYRDFINTGKLRPVPRGRSGRGYKLSEVQKLIANMPRAGKARDTQKQAAASVASRRENPPVRKPRKARAA